MTTSRKYRACPFCGKEAAETLIVRHLTPSYVTVRCNSCKATGPRVFFYEDPMAFIEIAGRKWDRRVL